MNKRPPNFLELPLEERALMALTAAVDEVIEEHAREGAGARAVLGHTGPGAQVDRLEHLIRERGGTRRNRPDHAGLGDELPEEACVGLEPAARVLRDGR